ncbi:MAG: MerR family transcriptional regulator [Paracoccaceae bacterium]
MEKSRDAFRTISEVADWLDVPTHVLRFWESRFSQIKPVKRAGGRRYYRPSDMRVIGGVKTLLHDQGMTIRGVQKLFREQGIKHISSHAPVLYGEDDAAPETKSVVIDHDTAEPTKPVPAARSTRDATPDPIIDDAEEAVEEVEELTVELDEPAEPETAEVAEPVLQFSRGGRATPKEAEAPPAPLEVSADVPKTDPQDDDAAFAATPGVAAQLRMIPRDALGEHKDLLSSVVDKLKALHARAD